MAQILIVLLLAIASSFAAITGKTVDNQQNPIAGVTVYFAQENMTVLSGADGSFSLNVDEATLNYNMNEVRFNTTASNGTLEIFNMSGKSLHKKNVGAFNRLYEVLPSDSDLPGIFLVKLKSENGESIFKIAHSPGQNDYKILTQKNFGKSYAQAYEIVFSKTGYYNTSRWVNNTDQDVGNVNMQVDPNASSSSSSSSSVVTSSSSYDGNCPAITPISGGTSGYGTRYWDCCKPHCSWKDKTAGQKVCKTCDINNNELDYSQVDAKSSCDGGNAHVCYSQIPFAKCDNVAYGYAAVPATSDICGRCYQLEFDGKGKYSTNAAHKSLQGKTLIVMATNIGHDVQGGQFDLMIPGGGVGAFNGCSNQWGVSNSQLGAQYGGFLTACQDQLGYNASMDSYKSCVRTKCQAVFNKSGMEKLMAGCNFFVDWMNAADNPTLKYKEVACPQELKDGYGYQGVTINW